MGIEGEAAIKMELEKLGWIVTSLNTSGNEPNVDLIAQKYDHTIYLQVKTYNDYGWISGGGVNPEICAGGSLFNKANNARYKCDFVICLTPASPGDKRVIRDDWRYFVMPVNTADQLFHININAYFNSPKRDGSPKVKRGACQDWVGPGPIPTSIVPDHKQDYLPFENNFELLESSL
ncbi:MAG: hypothetical protein ABID84_00995 [Chloroflexota bacterium]